MNADDIRKDREEGTPLFIGAQNDILYLIDSPPSPAPFDGPIPRKDGPSVIAMFYGYGPKLKANARRIARLCDLERAYLDQADRITELEAQLTTAEAALDGAEIEGGLTSNGNLWRYWSRLARETAAKNTSLRMQIATARDDALEEAAKVADKHPNWLCGGVKELEQANIHKAAAEDIADAIRALNRRR